MDVMSCLGGGRRFSEGEGHYKQVSGSNCVHAFCSLTHSLILPPAFRVVTGIISDTRSDKI